jgi:hypothetical protein
MRPTHLHLLVIGALLLGVAGCGTAAPAPPVAAVGEACTEASSCIGMPDGWTVADRGPRHVTIEHPDGADATVGFVEMDRVVAATGGAWPQPPEQVARSLWALFDGGEAGLDSVETLADGSVRTAGSISTGTQWHLLVPLQGTSAAGVVVRAPSSAWVGHVDAIFAGLELR